MKGRKPTYTDDEYVASVFLECHTLEDAQHKLGMSRPWVVKKLCDLEESGYITRRSSLPLAVVA